MVLFGLIIENVAKYSLFVKKIYNYEKVIFNRICSNIDFDIL